MSKRTFDEDWKLDKKQIELEVGFFKRLFCGHKYPRMNRADHRYYPGEYTEHQCSNCGQWYFAGSRTMAVVRAENKRLGIKV